MNRGLISLMRAMSYPQMVKFRVLTRFLAGEGDGSFPASLRALSRGLVRSSSEAWLASVLG
jgi:hypothetical protein